MKDAISISTNLTPKEVLKKYFGYAEFRQQQAAIIKAALQGKHTLVLMPTGGGKSICFQIPALMLPGLTLVVSPLISLMKDQVDSLKANGIKAAYLNSSISIEAQRDIEQELLNNELKLLYTAPERLVTYEFRNLLSKIKLSLVAIDEAHCISQWGHDFRQEYTQLGFLNDLKIPIMALTATADKITRRDIIKQLEIKDSNIFVASFDRPNLNLDVRPGQKKMQQLLPFLEAHQNESGIIYCLSRKGTEQLAEKLNDEGYQAAHYHAGVDNETKMKVQEAFQKDDMPIIVATIAFGMGIDKSNVRFIVHYNLPKNLESYYQEIGRAGRDGLPSDTILFYSYADVMKMKSWANDSGQPELQNNKLQRIQQYAEASICRRRMLLSYFGEHYDKDCGNCDVCKNPPKYLDGTVLAQKALSTIERMQRKGVAPKLTLLAEVLRGSGKKELYTLGLDKLPTYGIGRDVSFLDWQQYLVQMLHLGLFEIAYDEHNTLKTTTAGWRVLKGEVVKMVKPVSYMKKKAAAESAAKKKTIPEDYDNNLFEALRSLRKAIAVEENVPPFVIFHDSTLKSIAAHKPQTLAALAEMPGIGEHKLNKYGEKFRAAVAGFVSGNIVG